MALVSLYNFEQAGVPAIDAVSGFNLPDVVSGPLTVTPGQVGNALNADLSFGYVFNDADVPPWDNGNALSISYWVFFNRVVGTDEFVGRLGGAFGGRLSNLRRRSNGRLDVELRSETQTFAPQIIGPLVDSTWYHIAFTFEAGVGFIAYLDGAEEIPLIAANDSAPLKSQVGDPLILLGADAVGGRQLDGLIDEFAVFGHALTPAEVSAQYNGGSGTNLLQPIDRQQTAAGRNMAMEMYAGVVVKVLGVDSYEWFDRRSGVEAAPNPQLREQVGPVTGSWQSLRAYLDPEGTFLPETP